MNIYSYLSMFSMAHCKREIAQAERNFWQREVSLKQFLNESTITTVHLYRHAVYQGLARCVPVSTDIVKVCYTEVKY